MSKQKSRPPARKTQYFIVSVWPRDCDEGSTIELCGKLKPGIGVDFLLSDIMPHVVLEPLKGKARKAEFCKPRLLLEVFEINAE
ncbi:MAG: hypothetical protein AAF492_26130 [Verrucomicrobiota bacterium]